MIGPRGASDQQIWNYAREHGFVIVTKDDDYRALSLLFGAPPKLIMIDLGNCPTKAIETLLRAKKSEVETFVADTESALMILT